MNQSDTFCPELWQRIFVNQVNDQWHVKPCCYAVPTDSNSMMIQDGRRIFEIYNQSDNISALRARNQQGQWDQGCSVCEINERSMGSSGRTHAVAQYRPPMTESSDVDLNLGNLCNLACAICDPNSSTSWVPIYNKMNEQSWTGIKYVHKGRPVIDDAEWFGRIRRLQLQGGEIFLQTNYLAFFENLARHRDLSDIEIRIFTNGTVIPDPGLWKLLCQAGRVELYFSIDDIGPRFEYQRHGAKWDKVVENIEWFRQHAGPGFNLGIHPTYSILNSYYLAELVAYFQDRFPDLTRNYGNYFIGTGPLSVHSIPGGVRDRILDRTNTVPELAFLQDYIQGHQDALSADTIDYIKRYDLATQNSYAATHPEFWQILQEHLA